MPTEEELADHDHHWDNLAHREPLLRANGAIVRNSETQEFHRSATTVTRSDTSPSTAADRNHYRDDMARSVPLPLSNGVIVRNSETLDFRWSATTVTRSDTPPGTASSLDSRPESST